jgi:hypothetical protein
MRKIVIFLIIFCQLCCFNQSSWANSSMEEEMKAMKEQFADMQTKMSVYEKRIADLEDQLSKQSPQPPVASIPNRLIPGKWTPEIGVVADTVLKLDSSKEDVEGNNRLALRELELVLGSNVDPFSRLDATISFSDSEDEPVALEEAYLTRFGLPFDATARIGKFKPKVGKVLGTHRDSLDTVDEPLVIQRYFGTEGMSKTGIDLSKTLDLPWPVTQQVVLGILEGGNGEDGTAFGTTQRAPTLYGHLKNYMDITETTGLEVGFSPMFGSGNEKPGFNSHVLGADITLNQHIGPVQTIKWQNEVFNVNHRKTAGIDTDADGFADVKVDGNVWGGYSLLDYHFHPAWSVGFRYDYAQLVNNDPTVNPHTNDQGKTGYLTFYQSEFARWRLQYSHTSLATGKDDNAVYFQGTFAIGDHKHKI